MTTTSRRSYGDGALTVRQSGPRRGEVMLTIRKDGRRSTRALKARGVPGPDGRLVPGRAAEREARELRARLQALTPAEITAERTTLNEWAAEWLRKVRGRAHRSPNTAVNYDSVLRNHVLPYLGHERLGALTVLGLERWLERLEAAGVSTAVRRHALNVLRITLGAAVKRDVLLRNVAERVELPEHTPRKPPEITPALGRRIIAAASLRRYGVAVQLALATGMRRGEVLGLRWEDVDLGRGLVHVRGQRRQVLGRMVPGETKTRRQWTVGIPPGLVAVLRALQVEQRQRALLYEGYRDSGYVLQQPQTGAPVHARSLDFLMKKLRADLGLADVHFHDFRHAATSLKADLGVPDYVRQRELGHSRPRSTDHYTGVSAAQLTEGAAALGKLLWPSRVTHMPGEMTDRAARID